VPALLGGPGARVSVLSLHWRGAPLKLSVFDPRDERLALKTSQAGRVMDRAGSRRSGRSCAMALARRKVLILGAIGAGAAVAGGLVGALALQAQSGAADLRRPRFETFRRQAHLAGVAGPRRSVQLLGNLVCSVPRRDPMLVAVREVFAAKGAEIVGIGIDQAAKVENLQRPTASPTPC